MPILGGHRGCGATHHPILKQSVQMVLGISPLVLTHKITQIIISGAVMPLSDTGFYKLAQGIRQRNIQCRHQFTSTDIIHRFALSCSTDKLRL